MWRAEDLPGVVQTLLTPPPRPAAERYRHELKYLIYIGFIRLLFAVSTCKLLIINNIFKALI